MWNRREIQEIVGRLNHFRNEIHIHLTHQIQQKQVTDISLKPIQESITSMLQKANELGAVIEGLQSDPEYRLDRHQSQILRALNDIRNENAQLQAETIQGVISSGAATDSHLRDMRGVESNLNTLAQRQTEYCRISCKQRTATHQCHAGHAFDGEHWAVFL
jgi:hypothetical protein